MLIIALVYICFSNRDCLIQGLSIIGDADIAEVAWTLIEQLRLALLLVMGYSRFISVEVVENFDDLLPDEFVLQNTISRFALLEQRLRQNCVRSSNDLLTSCQGVCKGILDVLQVFPR